MSLQPPEVPVFTAGSDPLPADFNRWVQAPFAALTGKVVFRAAKTNAQSLSSGYNTVAFNSIIEDPYGGWSSANNAWSPPSAWNGTYVVKVGVWCAALSGGRLLSVIGLNGSTLYQLNGAWTNGSLPNGACGEAPVQLIGGQDQVSGIAWVSAASSVSTTTGQQCTMEITWDGN